MCNIVAFLELQPISAWLSMECKGCKKNKIKIAVRCFFIYLFIKVLSCKDIYHIMFTTLGDILCFHECELVDLNIAELSLAEITE